MIPMKMSDPQPKRSQWPNPVDFEAEWYPYGRREKVGYFLQYLICKMFGHYYVRTKFQWYCWLCGTRHPKFILREDEYGNTAQEMWDFPSFGHK